MDLKVLINKIKKTKFFIFFFILLIIILVFIKFYTSSSKDFYIYENLYNDYQKFVGTNYLLSVIVYLVLSMLWIALIGIFTPVLLFSIITFEYLGSIYSCLSFVLGSFICYSIGKVLKLNDLKIFNKKIKIVKDSFYLYVTLRIAPGVPFILKNLLGSFFNLNNKKFILACLISDIPQILLFSFLFYNIIESVDDLLYDNNFDLFLEKMFFPTTLIFIFLLFVYFIKRKYPFN